MMMSFLTLIITVCSASPSAIARDVASGFVLGHAENGNKVALHVLSTFKVPLLVPSFRFENIPDNHLKNNTFTLVPDLYSFDRNVWSNGEEYCYMIKSPLDSKAPHGVWLIGSEVGVDSGILYYKPTRPSISPATEELGGQSWHYLHGKDWLESSVIVTDYHCDASPQLHFSIVEFIDNGSLQTSVLLFSDPRHLGVEEHVVTSMLSLLSQSNEITASFAYGEYPRLWDRSSKRWASFTVNQTIPFGAPRILMNSAGAGVIEGSTVSIVHLVNVELLYMQWRLSLRTSSAGNEVEIFVFLDNEFLADGYYFAGALDNSESSSLTGPSADMARAYHIDLQANIGRIKVGEYAWLFHQSNRFLGRSCGGNVCDDNLVLKCISASKRGDGGDTSPYVSDILVFQYFESDRRDVMGRSMLSQTSSFLIASWRSQLDGYELRIDGAELSIYTAFVIGEPIKWIADHLESHEKILSPSLSSCFLYHAGVSLPPQFVYAAEILCVLMGAKPLVMIQFTSRTDHQWKFPLVPQLSQAIIAGKHVVSAFGEITHTVNRYNSDETLILYRKNRKYNVDLLRPNNTAQALHIVPYPSEAGGDPQKEHKVLLDQIFNSWFNGYLLGYPEHFINSYCYNFHSNLPQKEKEDHTDKSRATVKALFDNLAVAPETIGMGMDSNLLEVPGALQFLENFEQLS